MSLTAGDRAELVAFLQGKTITGLRLAEQGDLLTGFDLIFEDGSELEVYALAGGLGLVAMTAEEVREVAELDLLEAQIDAGQAPLLDHADVWADEVAEPPTE